MTATAPPLTPDPLAKLSLLARDIKVSHTVFAMPFAVLGAVLAAGSRDRLPSFGEVVLILTCMVFARSYAMIANRLLDNSLDAANPRTQGRALPAGRLSRRFMLGALGVNVAGFLLAAALFWPLFGNPWPIILALPVLALLGAYSLTKRFTWLCHVVLGASLAASPVAAAIALEPGYLGQPTVWLIAAMVLCWVAGFDVIYALQDVEVDRELKLFSMPASLGVEPALWISRGLHAVSAGMLLAVVMLSPQLAGWFLAASILAAGLLVLEHALVWRSQTNHIHMAFFTVNGVISVLLGLAGTLDVMLAL